ncbi:MAG: hypothetical protein WC261_07930 [Synergistaceae bacterium]|jgi:hypothetical protein
MGKKVTCDRQAFIDCANGDLLIVEKGVVKALGDAASEAMEAHERGEKIYLTVDGVIVSTVQNFKEELIDDKDR